MKLWCCCPDPLVSSQREGQLRFSVLILGERESGKTTVRQHIEKHRDDFWHWMQTTSTTPNHWYDFTIQEVDQLHKTILSNNHIMGQFNAMLVVFNMAQDDPSAQISVTKWLNFVIKRGSLGCKVAVIGTRRDHVTHVPPSVDRLCRFQSLPLFCVSKESGQMVLEQALQQLFLAVLRSNIQFISSQTIEEPVFIEHKPKYLKNKSKQIFNACIQFCCFSINFD